MLNWKIWKSHQLHNYIGVCFGDFVSCKLLCLGSPFFLKQPVLIFGVDYTVNDLTVDNVDIYLR